MAYYIAIPLRKGHVPNTRAKDEHDMSNKCIWYMLSLYSSFSYIGIYWIVKQEKTVPIGL